MPSRMHACHSVEAPCTLPAQELYTTDGSGTMISLDLYDGIRRFEILL